MGTGGSGSGKRDFHPNGKGLKKSPHRAGQYGAKQGGYFYGSSSLLVKGSISIFNGVIFKLEKGQLAVMDLIKHCVFLIGFSPKVKKNHFY